MLKNGHLLDEMTIRRYFRIAGVTIQVEADLPITDRTFDKKFDSFKVDGPGADTVILRHHFSLPEVKGADLGREVYRKPPWAIYRRDGSWVYLGITPTPGDPDLHRVAVFNDDHNRGRIYNPNEEWFRRGGLHALTLFPSDQILLARLLPDRHACFLHAAGMAVNGQGLLFVGHSEAGKSTMVTMLRENGEILCDDRVIVRRWPEGFRVHGSWSHGDVPQVSAADAPLRAILFLEKAGTNRLERLEDRKEIVRRLPFFLIKPAVTADWWEKTLGLVEKMAREVPVYRLRFDRSGGVKDVLKPLWEGRP
jgi:hypothetical protein